MKKLFIPLFMLLCIGTVWSQVPESFNYQAVVRDGSGTIIDNQSINFRTSIRDLSTTGTILYQETHLISTNDFGLANLEIGNGILVSGSFATIPWGINDKYLEVECDPSGGTSFEQMGTARLRSVPYSLFSRNSGSSYWEKDGDNISYSDGRVGIGTNNPLNPLHVAGSALFRSTEGGIRISTGSDWGAIYYANASGMSLNIKFNWGKTIFYGLVGIGTETPSYPLHVKDSKTGWLVGIHNEKVDTEAHGLVTRADYGDPLLVQSLTENIMIIKNSGKVGIGTLTPDARLHVNDRIRIGEDPSYSTVYGELFHEGAGTGFKINAHAGGGGWGDMHLQTNGSTRLFIESGGKVGIGTTSPIHRLQVTATGSENAIQGYSPSGIGVYAVSASNNGIFAQSSVSYAGYFSGNVFVTGSLSKGSGSFVIDHPLDPENKTLRHNFVESPENLLIYRGKAQLDGQGEALVYLPDYFQALTKEDEASIHLTPVGRPFLTGAEWNTDFTAIIIYGDQNREVFWEVLADRDDPVIHELGKPVEEEKGGQNTLCEKGLLLYPAAYGFPESKGRDYEYKEALQQLSENEQK